MSAVAERIPLAEAEALAARVVELLRDVTVRVVVAGSIRRRRPTIGDVEIVCEPKVTDLVQADLFGERVGEPLSLVDGRCDNLIGAGVFQPRLDVNGRPALGSRHKRLVFRERPVDLFIEPRPECWGVTLLLRTGSAEFNKRLVAPRPYGWMPSGMHLRGAHLERLTQDGWQAIPTPTEEAVFAALGRPYVEPERREV